MSTLYVRSMRKTSLMTLGLGLAAALAVVAISAYEARTGEPPRRADAAKPLMDVPLVGAEGPTSLAALKGKWSLLLFGYTTCPDVCPTSLAYLAKEMRNLGPIRNQVNVAFISVDPKRDEPKALANYVHHFDPNFFALTGEEANLQTITKGLGAYFALEPAPDSAAGYLVTHSGSYFVLDPNGRFVKSLPAPHERGAVGNELIRLTGGSAAH